MMTIMLKKYDFDNKFLNKNRSILEIEVIDNLTKSREKTKELLRTKYKMTKDRLSFVDDDVVCNGEWPICILDTEYRSNIVNHLVLQTRDDNFELNEDYFSNQNINKIDKKVENNCKNFSDILIERRIHICGNKISKSVSGKCEIKNKIDGEEENQVVRKRSYDFYVNNENNSNFNNFISGINTKCKGYFYFRQRN